MKLSNDMKLEIKISKNGMLLFLKRVYFDKIYSKEEISSIYRLVTGKEPSELISKCGRYKLTVTNKKRIKICLQNLDDDVIYNYNVGIKFLWKSDIRDCISDALLDTVYRSGIMW